MGKNKNGGKGPSNTAPAKPHTVGNAPEDEKSKDNSNVIAEGEAMPGVDASVNAHACVDVNPPIVGHANPSVFPDAKRGRGDSFRKTQYIQGMYWRTGDVQVLVGGTHEFRLHQEILAAHSTFFSNQLRASADSDDIMVVTRSEDMPVIVLREITHEAFSDVLRLLYPQPNAIKQPDYTSYQAERLLQTAVALGMPGIIDFAMDKIFSNVPGCSPIRIYRIAEQYSLRGWQRKAITRLVYRSRALTDDEAEIFGATLTAQVARFRELFRARIFARFEPVIQQADGSTEPQTHKGGPDSEAVMKYSATVTGGPDLGRCQQAILEALKLVFDVEGSGSHLAQYILKEEASITQNLETWLRLGGIGGGASLCKGCAESVGRVVQVYCRVEEMNARMERGLTLEK
ncbi:hypothetical protein FRC08_013724 [Ceratobasidium sp. 394]|nr:hypothetical protein FRC08_013724 [Ceratobasidium sp. 394]